MGSTNPTPVVVGIVQTPFPVSIQTTGQRRLKSGSISLVSRNSPLEASATLAATRLSARGSWIGTFPPLRTSALQSGDSYSFGLNVSTVPTTRTGGTPVILSLPTS